MTRSPAERAPNETSVPRFVNLNAFCSRFSTADSSMSRSTSTSSPSSTSATVNVHSRASASSDADSLTLATKSVRESSSFGDRQPGGYSRLGQRPIYSMPQSIQGTVQYCARSAG